MIEQVKVPATKSNYITSIPGPTYSQRRDPPQLTALPHSHSHHTCAHTFHQCATVPEVSQQCTRGLVRAPCDMEDRKMAQKEVTPHSTVSRISVKP